MVSLYSVSLLLGHTLCQIVHSAASDGTTVFVDLLASRRTTLMNRTPSPVEGSGCGIVAQRTDTRLLQSSGSGFGSKGVKKTIPAPVSSPSTYELFELQELRAQLQTIIKQNILIQSLAKEKRQELSAYVKAVVDKTDSPIDFSGRMGNGNTMGTAMFVAALEGKSWRMIFSTDANSSTSSGGEGSVDATGDALPYGTSVILRVGPFMGTEGTLDYVLKYSKQIMGLKELVAKSSCSIDIGPVNPGLLTYQYKDIKTNVFGISNLPVGFFGLLKGRINYIDTVWFDGERWIERNYLENGDVVYSVYVRDVEDEKVQKVQTM